MFAQGHKFVIMASPGKVTVREFSYLYEARRSDNLRLRIETFVSDSLNSRVTLPGMRRAADSVRGFLFLGVNTVKEIQLSDGQLALVDDEDYDELVKLCWNPQSRTHLTCYASHTFGRGSIPRQVLMHRYIMQPPDHLVIDHIDGNGLNNQKTNLRIVTRQQNNFNRCRRATKRSRFKGVYINPNRNGWQAVIRINNKRFSLNRKTEEDAARAYDILARRYHGEFARLNFPGPGEQSAISKQEAA